MHIPPTKVLKLRFPPGAGAAAAASPLNGVGQELMVRSFATLMQFNRNHHRLLGYESLRLQLL